MGLRICSLILAIVLAQGLARADPDRGDSDRQGMLRDPVIAEFERARGYENWAQAAAVMRAALTRAPDNAEYHNLYAFALRKGPNPEMDVVFKHYREALRLEPAHRGAHEYIGEAYLLVGDLGKAKEHLAVLDRLCFFGCEEYDDLKKAVATYETKGR